MRIIFKDNDLEELVLYGSKATGKKYRKYARDPRFLKALNYQIAFIRAASTFESLLHIAPLHYERLKHEMAGYSSFRVSNDRVERVICVEQEDEIELEIITLDTTHYGNKK